MAENKYYRDLTSCLLCGGTDFQKLIYLEDICLTGYFPKMGEADPLSTPVSINRCRVCDGIQAGELVSNEFMFDDYWYRSGTTQSMREHLYKIVDKNLQNVSSWLDIGSNDGTLISRAKEKGIETVCGVEPSKAFLDCDKNIKNFCINDFFATENCLDKICSISTKFDVISAISMFYDIAEPVDFLKKVKLLLSNEGKAIIEVNYAKSFFERGNIDMLGQEHLVYYFIKTFKDVTSRAGLYVNDAYLTDMNGGNITFTLSTNSFESTRLMNLVEKENKWISTFDFHGFQTTLDAEFMSLRKALLRMSVDKKIKILGASTRGSLIAQWLRLTPNIISSAVDLQKNKKNRFIPGTGIRIEYDPEAVLPDIYLVMPYQFKEEIIKRYDQFMKDGGSLVFYRPKMGQYKYIDSKLTFTEIS